MNSALMKSRGSECKNRPYGSSALCCWRKSCTLFFHALAIAAAPVMAAEQAGPPQSNYEKLIEILVWPLAVIIIVIIIAYLARDKIPGLFDRLIELSYKGGIAKFAERADDALTTAAREALKRPSDRIDDFTNEDYELAIDLYAVQESGTFQRLSSSCGSRLRIIVEFEAGPAITKEVRRVLLSLPRCESSGS